MKRLAMIAVLSLVACKPSLLPGTTVEDTSENRRVVEFVTAYRDAIERRSVDGIVALCAPDYFEDNGTVDQTDDYGIDGLKDLLGKDFQRTKTIQIEILVQNVEAKDHMVHVDYRFKQRALIAMESGEQWVTSSDVNRLVLRENEDVDDALSRYQIVSGL